MRLKHSLLPLLFAANTASAQLTITPGAQLSVAGNMQLTLQNTDLINNGNFAAGNGMVAFSGNASSFLSGNQSIQFSEIEINKTNSSSLLLQRAIGVLNRTLFTSGFLNLNGFNIDLGTTGHLDGEKENSRMVGSNGGEVLFNVDLNNPTNSNPANLGVFITANQNLGNVRIKRGHQSQTTIPGPGSSVLRYYDILPANSSNFIATLRFSYFNGELNGHNEVALSFFESQNTINWTDLGFTTRDTVSNIAEKSGISSFARFTLSSPNNPLPVSFILFNAKCEENKVLLTWKTAQEQNSSRFDVERSIDGATWTVIGTLPAAGNSNSEKTYFFTDNHPADNSFYRIAEYDVDGRVSYTNMLRSSCNATDVFRLWPNPAYNTAFINIVAGNPSQVLLKVMDSKGALIKMQRRNLFQGSNQLSIDMSPLTNGTYFLLAEWNNGQMRKTVRVLKL